MDIGKELAVIREAQDSIIKITLTPIVNVWIKIHPIVIQKKDHTDKETI
jgi:hypothetical protein|tara:strand:- start:519 stop:665 length:147 start_codon:yes stop_codon:yes gene_type:complete